MIESIIMMLIYLCLLALAVYLVIYVLGAIGVNLPPQVVKILWVVVMLVAILLIVRLLLPHSGRVFGFLELAPIVA